MQMKFGYDGWLFLMVLKYDKLKNWAIVLFEINQFYFVSSVWNFSMPEQSNGVTFALIVTLIYVDAVNVVYCSKI